MKELIQIAILFFPWRIRRFILCALFGFEIHPSCRIGLSLICPQRLEMGPGSRIGHLTMCKGLTLLKLGEASRLGNLNWITGFPAGTSGFFQDDPDRKPELTLGDHAAITNRHLIDCTSSVQIGRFTTLAGFRSQLLTHSIDLYRCRQASKPIKIGEYCFVGTASVLLGGSSLPSYSVLGANSLLNKAYEKTHYLYAGNPAKAVKQLPGDMLYFVRRLGFVN